MIDTNTSRALEEAGILARYTMCASRYGMRLLEEPRLLQAIWGPAPSHAHAKQHAIDEKDRAGVPGWGTWQDG